MTHKYAVVAIRDLRTSSSLRNSTLALMLTSNESSPPNALIVDTGYAKNTRELIQFVSTLRSLGYVLQLSLSIAGKRRDDSPSPALKCTWTSPALSSSATRVLGSPVLWRPSQGYVWPLRLLQRESSRLTILLHRQISVPRDAGTCTRAPMECRLSHSVDSWSCQISIRWEYD